MVSTPENSGIGAWLNGNKYSRLHPLLQTPPILVPFFDVTFGFINPETLLPRYEGPQICRLMERIAESSEAHTLTPLNHLLHCFANNQNSFICVECIKD
jgi:hypothetical protein